MNQDNTSNTQSFLLRASNLTLDVPAPTLRPPQLLISKELYVMPTRANTIELHIDGVYYRSTNNAANLSLSFKVSNQNVLLGSVDKDDSMRYIVDIDNGRAISKNWRILEATSNVAVQYVVIDVTVDMVDAPTPPAVLAELVVYGRLVYFVR